MAVSPVTLALRSRLGILQFLEDVPSTRSPTAEVYAQQSTPIEAPTEKHSTHSIHSPCGQKKPMVNSCHFYLGPSFCRVSSIDVEWEKAMLEYRMRFHLRNNAVKGDIFTNLASNLLIRQVIKSVPSST